ncbi:hypothetical protein AB7W94_23450, partial [Providencia rettgeri]
KRHLYPNQRHAGFCCRLTLAMAILIILTVIHQNTANHLISLPLILHVINQTHHFFIMMTSYQ